MKNIFDDHFLYFPEVTQLPSRDEIDINSKWNVNDIYKNDNEWESDFKLVEEKIPGFEQFEGTLGDNSENLFKCIKYDEEVSIILGKLYLYSMLNKDCDMTDSKYLGMSEKVKSLHSKLSAASSFIQPEIIEIPEEKLYRFIEEKKELNIYKFVIDELLRGKKHTRTKEIEEILALVSEPIGTPYNAFSIFTNADMDFGVVKDEEGNDIQISHGRYSSSLFSKNRDYRQRVYKSFYQPFKKYARTLNTLFNGNFQSKVFYARAKNFNSALEASLFGKNVPVTVYDNLVKTANDNLAPLHRWAELKKKLLKIEELHPYDVYVTVFEQEVKKYSYDESKEILLNAFKPLGEDYLNSLRKAFNNRWIDVYETKGKRSGAYSSGVTYGVHPYVLLNWNNNLNDVFTFAHEMGHNMHSLYTGLNQPYPYAGYSIFVAEVASTFNEALLLDYLIKTSTSIQEKLFLLEKYLNDITSTFYRQIMFAEFEKDVCERMEQGNPLTTEGYCELFRNIYQKYWGSSMVVDDEESYTWARVPHFYYNFYVFQYATGFASSEVLAAKVLNDGKPAIDKYLNFLSAGNSDHPLNILKNAGVDMNSTEPVLAVTRKMNQLLDEIENLLER